jgi:Flp pilus assembly protein TadG
MCVPNESRQLDAGHIGLGADRPVKGSPGTVKYCAKPGSFIQRMRHGLIDSRGSAAVEFGLVAMPFFAALFAVLEIGYNSFLISALDYATQVSGRAVMTGSVSTSGLTASQFKTQVVCPALPSNFNCSNIFVNMSVVTQGQSPTGYYSYVNSASSGLVQPALNNSQLSFCPGSGSQYVVLQIMYPAPFLTAFFSAGATTNFNGQMVHVLLSSMTFKSEPYTGATTYAGC